MLLNAPNSSPYDWEFSIFGIHVRVAWGFWIAAAVIGWNWSQGISRLGEEVNGQEIEPVAALAIWIGALLVSILVHELGHSLAMRYFGLNSHIVLYHFGGLAIPDSFGRWNGARTPRIGPKQQLVISAAGPIAQLAFGLLMCGIGIALKVRIEEVAWLNRWLGTSLGTETFPESTMTYALFSALIYPSIFWAILNLAPVLPLDGGQIAHSILQMTRVNNPTHVAYMLSVGTGVLIGIWMLRSGENFGIMWLLFAASNWQAMQSGYRGY